MRAVPKDWDLPDGVLEGDTAAAEVAKDIHLSRALRGYKGAWRPPDADYREYLMARARRGDEAAAKELLARYKVRLIPPAPSA